MSAGWVAGSVRARMLGRRQLGADACRRLAGCHSLADALAALDQTAYRVPPDRVPRASANPQHALEAAQRAVSEALLWDLRVLAGWLPRGGTATMRTLAGWFEVANVSERLHELDTGETGQYFELGTLATAWPQVRLMPTSAAIRRALATSAWQDPGGDSASAINVGLRAQWARRVAALGEPARTWAAAATALLLASERFAAGRPDNPALKQVASALLGRAQAAQTLEEFAAALPGRLSWAIHDRTRAADLWRNEAVWWRRVGEDGHRLLIAAGYDHQPVVGAAAVLAADARRIGSALEIAARGGGSLEEFDAVA